MDGGREHAQDRRKALTTRRRGYPKCGSVLGARSGELWGRGGGESAQLGRDVPLSVNREQERVGLLAWVEGY